MSSATYKILTQPTQEPFAPEDLQGQLNADQTDDGGKAGRVLTAARKKVELDSGVSLMPTVWQRFSDGFYDCENDPVMKLTRGPVTAVGSVIYKATDGTDTTLNSGLYQSDLKRTPSRIMPAYGYSWPTARSSTLNAVTVEFTAGFASVSLVPKTAIQAALMLAAFWTEDPSMMEMQTVGADISFTYWNMIHAVHWEVFDE